MKPGKLLVSLLVTIVLISGFGNSNIIVEAQSTYSRTSSTTTAKSYYDFYKSLQHAITFRKSSLTLKIKNYSSRKYNIAEAIKKIQYNNPKLNYIISGYSYNKHTLRGYTTVTISLKYTYSDKVANNYKELYNYIKAAALAKNPSIKIKLNKYTSSSYNTSKAFSEILKEKFNGYHVSKLNLKNVKDLDNKNIIVNIAISYVKNPVSTATTISQVQPSSGSITQSTQSTQSSSITVVKTDSELYNTIKTGLANVTEINVSVENSSMNSGQYVFDMAKKVAEDNPDLNYISMLTVSGPSSSNDYTVSFTYDFTKDKVLQMTQAVDDKVKYIVNNYTNSSMNEYQKELALHDYLVNHTKYDTSNYNKGTIPNEDYTAYGALINGTAVCEGYATAMYKLLKTAGIDNMVVTGYAGGDSHAWNIVKIGGEHYQLDSTWDDPVTSNGSNILSHDYFNVTDNQLARDHTWDTSKYPNCTSTTYRYRGI